MFAELLAPLLKQDPSFGFHLNMACVNRVVKMYHGSLTSAGNNLRMQVKLPVKRTLPLSNTHKTRPEIGSSTTPNFADLNIMLVDDDQSSLIASLCKSEFEW